MEFHPLADAFPLLTTGELKQLAQSIETNGQREPIVLYDGKILDGRNRYRACLLAGVEPTFVQFTGDNPLALVKDRNVLRRQLSGSQLGIAAGRLYMVFRDQGTPKSCLQVAEEIGSNQSYVAQAVYLIEQERHDLVGAVERGERSLHDAYDTAKREELAAPLQKAHQRMAASEVLEKKKLSAGNAIKRLWRQLDVLHLLTQVERVQLEKMMRKVQGMDLKEYLRRKKLKERS